MGERRRRNVAQGAKAETPRFARALQDVRCLRTNELDVCALEFVDSSGRSFAAVVNSNGIASVIGRLLDQACDPGFEAAAVAASAELPRCEVNGSGLALTRGRSPAEVAVRLPIGCIELVLFLPAAELLLAFADFARQFERVTPEEAQH